jgi:hypothetical protein
MIRTGGDSHPDGRSGCRDRERTGAPREAPAALEVEARLFGGDPLEQSIVHAGPVNRRPRRVGVSFRLAQEIVIGAFHRESP